MPSRKREMGLTRAEFLRLLPLVLQSARLEAGGVVISAQDAAAVRIECVEGAPRSIGSLVIPVLDVTFHFGGSDADADAFMTRFDRVFQRGGG